MLKKLKRWFKDDKLFFDNKTYNGKVTKNSQRDEIRSERRLKKINRYDPDVTEEPPIENFNPSK